jgi:hypothetical protein
VGMPAYAASVAALRLKAVFKIPWCVLIYTSGYLKRNSHYTR